MVTIRSLGSYGPNPNAGISVNADHGWGGYQWPGGVPAALLGVATYKGVSTRVRKELVPLFVLAYRIAEKHGYTIHTRNPNGNGENWGPWGYENRPIGGGSTPSNHSKGKANDWNAPYNPYSTNNFQSDFPVAMVADLESIGLGWGGRYGDTMHWEYAYSPADVPRHIAKALSILGGEAVGAAPAKPAAPVSTTDDEELDMATAQQIFDEVKEIHRVLSVILERSENLQTTNNTVADIQNKVTTILGQQK